MLADFLAPFWKWLFEKTGTTGLLIASFAPILLLALGFVLIVGIFAVIVGTVDRIKKKQQEKLRHRAIMHWDEDEYDEAVEAFLKLAKKRPLTAEEKYIMALICADGADSGWLYTNREYMENYWLKQAVEEEYPEAMKYAAHKDLLAAKSFLQAAKAVRRLRVAGEKGSTDAQKHLDDYEKRMREKGIKELLVGLIMGNADIQMAYGKSEFGEGHAEEAMEWLKLAGEYGNVNAICFAGMRYIQGDGVKKDTREGERLLKEAAEKNSAIACELLGGFYFDGLSGKTDVYKARDWFEKAIKLDEKNDRTMFGLAMCYENMLSERMEKLNFDQNAILEDSTCRRYTEENSKWMKKAAALGNQQAKAKLEEFYNASEYGRAVRIMEEIMEKKR